jgi:hypothetical protein
MDQILQVGVKGNLTAGEANPAYAQGFGLHQELLSQFQGQ